MLKKQPTVQKYRDIFRERRDLSSYKSTTYTRYDKFLEEAMKDDATLTSIWGAVTSERRKRNNQRIKREKNADIKAMIIAQIPTQASLLPSSQLPPPEKQYILPSTHSSPTHKQYVIRSADTPYSPPSGKPHQSTGIALKNPIKGLAQAGLEPSGSSNQPSSRSTPALRTSLQQANPAGRKQSANSKRDTSSSTLKSDQDNIKSPSPGQITYPQSPRTQGAKSVPHAPSPGIPKSNNTTTSSSRKSGEVEKSYSMSDDKNSNREGMGFNPSLDDFTTAFQKAVRFADSRPEYKI